jgi:hypothetical protein
MKEYVLEKWLDLANVSKLWFSMRKSARQFSVIYLATLPFRRLAACKGLGS